MNVRFAATALIGAAAIIAAGCGAKAHPPSQTTAATSDPVATAFKFASCMRQHGVPTFPDPKVSTVGPGEQRIAQVVPKTLAVSPQFQTAQKACGSLLPGPGREEAGESPQQIHARERDILAFAKCLRGHGLPDFPDPTAQGQLTIEMIRAAGVDLQAPGVLTAARICLPTAKGLITGADVERAVSGGS